MARKTAKQVGALWRHEKAGFGPYLTGYLDLGGLGEVPIVVFQNERKEQGSNQPDYRIVQSRRPNESESLPDGSSETAGNGAKEKTPSRSRLSGAKAERG